MEDAESRTTKEKKSSSTDELELQRHVEEVCIYIIIFLCFELRFCSFLRRAAFFFFFRNGRLY